MTTLNDPLSAVTEASARDAFRAVAVSMFSLGYTAADTRTLGAGGSTARLWTEVADAMDGLLAEGFDPDAYRERLDAEDERLRAEDGAR